jgi:hypothetical protein
LPLINRMYSRIAGSVHCTSSPRFPEVIARSHIEKLIHRDRISAKSAR